MLTTPSNQTPIPSLSDHFRAAQQGHMIQLGEGVREEWREGERKEEEKKETNTHTPLYHLSLTSSAFHGIRVKAK